MCQQQQQNNEAVEQQLPAFSFGGLKCVFPPLRPQRHIPPSDSPTRRRADRHLLTIYKWLIQLHFQSIPLIGLCWHRVPCTRGKRSTVGTGRKADGGAELTEGLPGWRAADGSSAPQRSALLASLQTHSMQLNVIILS